MLENVIGILLIAMGIFLVISVLMQSSKNHRMSGSIAGGAETFFGKQKGKQMDALLNKLTTVVTIIFVILVLVLYVIQPAPKTNDEILQELIDSGVITEEMLNGTTESTEGTEGTETDATEGDTTVTEGTEVEGTEETVEGTDGAEVAQDAQTPSEETTVE